MKPNKPAPTASGSTHHKSRRSVVPSPLFVEIAACGTVRLLAKFSDQKPDNIADNSAGLQQHSKDKSCDLQQHSKDKSCDLQQHSKDKSCGLQQHSKDKSCDLQQHSKDKSCGLQQHSKDK